MMAGERDERTELLAKHSFTVCFSSVKSVGGDSVLVPKYLMELNAWGTRPTSANLSLIISSGLFTFVVSNEVKKLNIYNDKKEKHLPKWGLLRAPVAGEMALLYSVTVEPIDLTTNKLLEPGCIIINGILKRFTRKLLSELYSMQRQSHYIVIQGCH